MEFIPDVPVTGSYTLLGLAADNHAADKMTAATVQYLAFRQLSDGRWPTLAARPPIEYSDVTATAISLRALQLYKIEGRVEEFRRRIRRAGNWLMKAKARSTEESAMQLMGLIWAKANPDAVDAKAKRLLAAQRPDGGWAQIQSLESDAYATGQALTALRMTGVIGDTNAAYRRGCDFLMRTQHKDGSWLVKTRSFPFQPYFESGFPHGPDQWISSAATGWAAMALLQSTQPEGMR